MISLLKNLYYRFYKLLKYWGHEDTPRYNAVLLLSIFMSLNFITGVAVLMIITNRILIVDGPRIWLFIIGMLIIAINSYIVFGKKRYLEIEAGYANESETNKLKNNLIVLLYIALSITLLILSLKYLNEHPIK